MCIVSVFCFSFTDGYGCFLHITLNCPCCPAHIVSCLAICRVAPLEQM